MPPPDADSATRLRDERLQLRQEIDVNRRFVFERPLLIAAAGLAAYAGLSEKADLRLLPIPVLAVLLFNLWFTYNRLRSTARIIAYIQLVHESSPALEWIGWESALRKYRIWIEGHQENLPPATRQYDNMVFYAPIFWFHLAMAAALVGLVIARDAQASEWADAAQFHVASALALVAFILLSIQIRASRLQFSIEQCRETWKAAFEQRPATEKEPPPMPLATDERPMTDENPTPQVGKSETDRLREEQQFLKRCQLQYLLFSLAAAGAVAGFAGRGNGAMPPHAYLAPLLIVIPCWWIFFDKATTITRIVGYLRLSELLDRADEGSASAFHRVGWESGLALFREKQGKRHLDNGRHDLFMGIWWGLKSLPLFTTQKYWVLNWWAFAALCGASLGLDLDLEQEWESVQWIAFGAVVVTALVNLSTLGRLTNGFYSYEKAFVSWVLVLRSEAAKRPPRIVLDDAWLLKASEDARKFAVERAAGAGVVGG